MFRRSVTENELARAHRRFGKLPAGERLFSLAFGRLVPYSGSVRPRIRELGPGRCVATIEDRRALRNHLQSIHAVALTNVAEMTTGLALNYALPKSARSIMTRIEIDFLKKARGRITATSETAIVTEAPAERVAHDVPSVLTDAHGDVVARAVVRWLVGPAGERK